MLLCVACTGAPDPGPVAPPAPAFGCAEVQAELEAIGAGFAPLTPDARVPPANEVIAACEALPEAARPCLSPTWALQHPAACEAAARSVSAAQQKTLRRALTVRAPLDGSGDPD